jgi:hypothetical protein
MLDRETTLQIGVSAGAVGIFIALAAFVAANFGTNNHLSESGGFVLVGGVALFVLVTTVAGLWLARQEFEDAEAADGS